MDPWCVHIDCRPHTRLSSSSSVRRKGPRLAREHRILGAGFLTQNELSQRGLVPADLRAAPLFSLLMLDRMRKPPLVVRSRVIKSLPEFALLQEASFYLLVHSVLFSSSTITAFINLASPADFLSFFIELKNRRVFFRSVIPAVREAGYMSLNHGG